MLIRVADRELVSDLCAHYARSGFLASSVGGGMIEVTRPMAGRESEEAQAIELHLQIWRHSNRGVQVEWVSR